METTRKQLVEKAQQLGAVRLAGNIYDYENKLCDITRDAREKGLSAFNHCIAYSHGIYGNNGRLDYVSVMDNKTCNLVDAYFVYYGN